MIVYACAEVIPGCKLNFALSFANGVPLLESLFSSVASLFQRARHELCNASKDAETRHVSACLFTIDEAVIYNPTSCSWSLLISEEQLCSMCQIYAFQPADVAATGIHDKVGQMPDPVKPTVFFGEFIASPLKQFSSVELVSLKKHSEDPSAVSLPQATKQTGSFSAPSSPSRRPSPPRNPLAHSIVQPPQLPAEVTSELFRYVDADHDGMITLFQLHDAMTHFGVDTSSNSVGKTFAYGDRAVSESVFSNFVHRYWSLAVCLVEKIREEKQSQQSNFGLAATEAESWKSQLQEIEAQESELLAKLQSLRKVKGILLKGVSGHSHQ